MAEPAGTQASHARLLLTAAAVVLALDQATKAWAVLIYRLPERGRVPVLPFMDFVFVKNTGVSYGLLAQGSRAAQLAFAAFAVAAAAAMTVWALRMQATRATALGFGLIVGGAVGNAIDRVLFNGVLDFVLLHAAGYSWYVFNIADAAIVAGVGALIYDWLRTNRKDATKPT